MTLGARPRLRLQTSVASHVAWLDPKVKRSECIGLVGRSGAFALVEELPPELTDAASVLEAYPLGLSEGLGHRADYARYAADIWRITISWEKDLSRVSLTIPEDPRKVGHLPPDGPVAVFLTREMIEIWSVESWRKLVDGLAKDPETLAVRAQEEP